MIRNRRRQALTNYKKRVELLKGGMPRIVVRKSNRGILVQIISYGEDGDKVITGISSKVLKSVEWQPRSNIPTAYLTGLMLAKRAKTMKIEAVVLDIGLYKPDKASVIFAAAKGAADGGLKVLNSIEFDEKRLSGQHIAQYAKALKAKGADDYKKQFSAYEESKFNAESIAETFAKAKQKIMA